MTAIILKAQLVLLFFLTLISCIAFYFQGSMPDHYLMITSKVESFSAFSYYFYSFINFTHFYTGPWVFIPFFIFTLLYMTIFSYRDYKFDGLNILFLLISGLFFSFVFMPLSLGPGLLIFLQNNLSIQGSFFLGLLAFFCLIAGILREKYFYFNKYIFNKMAHFFYKKPEMSMPLQKVKESFARPFLKGLFFFTKMRFKIRSLKVKLKWGKRRDNALKIIQHNKGTQILIPFAEKIKERGNTDKKAPKKTATFTIKKNHDDYLKLMQHFNPKRGQEKKMGPDQSYFNQIITRIEAKLAEFKIDGKIIDILKGPVVDTFELVLGVGVKISKVTSSAEDLSLALYGAPIRIVYPMRGRTTVGIEVPRNPREIIYLDEVLNTPEFQNNNDQLPIAMGKDAFGVPFIVDLARMPHMLVAGSTGAGKSVFINTLLVSLLVKKSPQKMQLILIDPKQLELALYAKLPHLIMPVIIESKRASLALLWAVQEMERRYSILKEFGVRHITSYNEKLKTAGPELLARIHGLFNEGDEKGHELPYIVVIVDEFADLILTKAGKEIENNICRLAGKARAAGIHLVLATQRPSVDVITGLIKSNFPTRVSFRVTTSIDSRTILNAVGAEKLLGRGDMLYKHGVETYRVHSSYVEEEEIEALTETLAAPDGRFREEVLDFLENGGEQEGDPFSYGSHISSAHVDSNNGQDHDDLYHQAVHIVLEHRTASASMLQRRLKVGYNRAANLIDTMEKKGVIGPAQGPKPREVYNTPNIY